MTLDLSQFDSAWAQSQPAPESAFDRLPDGTYQMLLERIEATATRNGRPCLLWTLKVLGPRFANRKHWHRDYLDKPETFAYLKKNFGLFGVRLDKLSEAPAHFASMAGKTVQVALKTTGDFQATYLNRVVGCSNGNGSGAGTSISGMSPF